MTATTVSSSLPRILLILGLGLLPACRKGPEQSSELDLKTAELAFNAGHYDAAKSSYLKILRGDPKNVKALAQLGRCHLQLGDNAEAQRLFDELKQRHPEIPQLDRVQSQISSLRAGT